MSDDELDARLADLLVPWDESLCRVCGWPIAAEGEAGCWSDNCSMRPAPVRRADAPPDFSSDGDAMLRLLEELTDRGWIPVLGFWADGKLRWTCSLRRESGPVKFAAHAPTAPEAVARAALKALEE